MDQQSDVSGYMEPGGKNATLIYILYLANIIVPFTAIVGVIFAYLNRGKGSAWLIVTTPIRSALSGSGCCSASSVVF